MKDNISACFTSNSDDWATPSAIYNKFIEKGFIDPCPFKSTTNGFGFMYKNKKIYINPPFSQNKIWCKYAVDLANAGNDVWLLIACRTDTNYFRYIYDNRFITLFFIQGRVAFNDKGHVPFPVMFVRLSKPFKVYNFVVCTQDELLLILDKIYK